MINKGKSWRLATVAAALMMAGSAWATEYSASFKNADIEEFINTVGKNLSKTIIIEPSVRGKINVRSYDLLNEEQYYQFFLSVLDVYGFAVVPMDNGVLKVVRSKDAKTSAIPVVDETNPGIGDEMVTRVVPVRNVSVRELAPLLRQLNDNAGGGNVVHYDPSNVLLITGRAAVVNRLVEVVRRVDKAGDQEVDIIKLKYASAGEMVRLVTNLNKDGNTQGGNTSLLLAPKVVADERTNSVVVSGEPKARARIIQMVRQLDRDLQSQGNTRVFYLKYGKAKDMVEVLKGVSTSIEADKKGGGTTAGGGNASIGGGKLAISADETTNALVITAQPDVMAELEQVVAKLDIRRAQVLVEAIIVEIADGDGLNLGVQWANTNGGGTQFTNAGPGIGSVAIAAKDYKDNGTTTGIAKLAESFNGMAAGFYQGNWAMLVTALSTNTKSDILSTPSIVTMDNKEASFNVGQEVPVQTGKQNSTSGDTTFSTIERKTVGTKLVVTPQINEGDSVLLTIEQEVSSVGKQASGTEGLGPTFDTRTVKNAVLVKSGETVVLGGLMDEQTKEEVSKVPLLGDIPVLGYLFRSTSNTTSKRNLMVFIRPTILRDANVYSGISSNKYTMFRAQQLEAAAQEGYLTSPDRQVLPEYGQDVVQSPEIQKQIELMKARQQATADGVQPFVQGNK
ncbi:type II secretion system protein GspD [Aeromonas salmonicida]|uniref:General secretion pathway protein GspD n=1 Tax=Aeromonas salmonicida subsp. pectinolytica 34mel TaxID=1324960 RepID=T0PNY9_AERSA|nr:GspD family T2SS secretin variant ExeD [Aeromonas salmonicida]ATP07745.1 general secretion pathway protein GspD [Aeromonas salmonicida subsp. pectinolytica 34mel]EQC04516.1 general secretion pathway protein D [Aeromonas salmonicida subsp. pectinolytica 34mel]MCE9967561.1 GspD family T2SS secretin variant ExeD [Aeromonas salmonicida]TNI19040.1 type II secretion system protein GspD [Aeromonas salmonicida]HEH9395430.1 GspD family T2SS secretin variant ExeD [Aeromonas salmonicida]